mmetsp:Transcript_97812/g.258335  ORF Transcript_97812/g.258335 Transcript_97812/m.258335 type:complete len:601 (-) Transcript_97812:230-2032(-)
MITRKRPSRVSARLRHAAFSTGRSVVLKLSLALLPTAAGLDNGLAITPPMGWLAWGHFRCNIDCAADPYNCISEQLFQQHADVMARDGWKDAGYVLVGIDDCWSDELRTDGKLSGDLERFPSGMAALAQYVHDRDLELGIYGSVGIMTCEGYLGICADEQCENDTADIDISTFAQWELDALKMDACGVDHTQQAIDRGYLAVHRALQRAERRVLFSCSWPFYLRHFGFHVNYTDIAQMCNTWRSSGDMQNNWDSVVGIAEWYAERQDDIVLATGPGRWNDMDQLVIGNGNLSKEQMRAHMAIWCIAASPLWMGNDLRDLSGDAREVLMNPEIIKVNQQSTPGGRRIHNVAGSHEVWVRRMDDGNPAVVLWNRGSTRRSLEFTATMVNITGGVRYAVRDLFQRRDLGCMTRSFSHELQPDDVLAVVISRTSWSHCLAYTCWSTMERPMRSPFSWIGVICFLAAGVSYRQLTRRPTSYTGSAQSSPASTAVPQQHRSYDPVEPSPSFRTPWLGSATPPTGSGLWRTPPTTARTPLAPLRTPSTPPVPDPRARPWDPSKPADSYSPGWEWQAPQAVHATFVAPVPIPRVASHITGPSIASWAR